MRLRITAADDSICTIRVPSSLGHCGRRSDVEDLAPQDSPNHHWEIGLAAQCTLRPSTRRGVTGRMPFPNMESAPFGAPRLAEKEGFEPSVALDVLHSLSRRARSATPASLRTHECYRFTANPARDLAPGASVPQDGKHGRLAEWFMAAVLKTVVG
jgi:hypothetical protein